MTTDTETKAALDTPTPIAALEQEILEYIFLLIATDHFIEAKDRARSIVSLSRVCKRWRGIVLGYTTLWSRIIDYYGSPTHIKNLLQLSEKSLLEFGHRKQPIIFAYKEGAERIDAKRVLALVLEHVPRLQSFNFCDRTDTDQCWSMVQAKFLSHPAPYIEYLALHISRGGDPISLLETALFEDRAPALRTINLDGCGLKLVHCPRIMENLGELQIKGLDKLPDAPTLKQWLHLLTLSPRLEWLVLVDSISRSSQPQYDSTPIALNQLKMLYLEASQSDCAALLKAVSIPGACGVRVEAKVHRHEAVNKSLLHVLSQRIDSSAHVSERQWTIGCFRPSNSESDIQISFLNRNCEGQTVGAASCPGWDTPEDGSSTGKVDPLVNVSVRFGPDAESHINDFSKSLWDTFASTYPSTTHLATYFRLPEAYRTTMIGPIANHLHLFRKLEILHIADDHHHSHPHFAIRGPAFDSVSDPMIFPALLIVELLLGNFIDDPPSQFIDFVRCRNSAGRPIKQIILEGVTVDRRHFESEIGDAVEHLDMFGTYDPELDGSDDSFW